MDEPAALLTIQDVAKLLQTNAKTVRRMVKDGDFPPPLPLRGVQRWNRKDYECWAHLAGRGMFRPKEPPAAQKKGGKNVDTEGKS